METSTFVVLPFALLAFFISSGESLKCVQCSSQSEPRCNDPFQANSVPLTDCTSDALKYANSALKGASNVFKDISQSLGFNPSFESPDLERNVACQKIDITINEKVQTIRSCALAKTSQLDPCATLGKELNSNTASLSHCSLCDKDGCNGASGVAPKALLLFAAVIISSLALFSRAH